MCSVKCTKFTVPTIVSELFQLTWFIDFKHQCSQVPFGKENVDLVIGRSILLIRDR